MRRKRRPTERGEFQDPLSNYAPPDYDDEMVRALCEETIDVMTTTPFTAIPETTTIEQALRHMAEMDKGCVLITDDGGRLVGLLTERDILNKVVEQFEAVRNSPVTEVMTKDPMAVHTTASPAKAMNLMAVGGFRHVPIVDMDEKAVGILGPRRVTHFLFESLHSE